jgi:hypothetical protein
MCAARDLMATNPTDVGKTCLAARKPDGRVGHPSGEGGAYVSASRIDREIDRGAETDGM